MPLFLNLLVTNNTWTGTNIFSGKPVTLSGNQSAAAWTTTGTGLLQSAATYTDTTSSGTVTTAYLNNLGTPTFAASAVTTYTNAATLHIGVPTAGTNVTLSKPISLLMDGAMVVVGASGTLSQLDANDTGFYSKGGSYNQFHLYGTAANVNGYLAQNNTGSTAFSGSGPTAAGMQLWTLSSHPVRIAANNTLVLTANTDGTVGVGASNDVFLTRSAAAILQLGAANAASPVAQTLQAQGSRSGTDTNVGGATITIQAGTGTGTGTEAAVVLKSPVRVASGTGAQTQTTSLTLQFGVPILPTYAFAGLPATPVVGMMAYVSDSSTATWGATIAGGGANKVVAWYNNANWTVMGA